MTPHFSGGAAEAAPDARASALAEGFSRQLAAWAQQRGASADVARLVCQVARSLSLAISEGHVCLSGDRLREAAGGLDLAADTLRGYLLASGVVGTPRAPGAMPLLLDEDGRLYLHRYFDLERRLAQRLMQAATAAPIELSAATGERLRTLFPGDRSDDTPDWQQLAVALALQRRLCIVSGGPGTGKTSTVVRLLACVLEEQPACRIALAAPTGKAAARLAEAVRERALSLPPAWREGLPSAASTIHRLLGATSTPGRFVHHAGNPLAVDLLVVDEASMLDLSLATRLLEAVPPSARIVLLGDKDQLAAVESGAVFAEISADPTLGGGTLARLAALCALPPQRIVPPPPQRPGVLHDAVVWFTRNYRFAADSALGHLAADINASRSAPALVRLRGEDDSLRWIDDGRPQPADALWQAVAEGYAPFVETVRREGGDRAVVARAFGAFRVLCAHREGARGTQAVNRWMTHHARKALGLPASDPDPWYPGRPVMVLRNDPVAKLFNGDIGIALRAGGGELRVFFADAEGGLRALPPSRLPAHESAYAMTVHKSQGSEFDSLLLLLPAQRSRALTRELLYTAVTRARRRITLCADAARIAEAIDTPTRRDSGLLARLREAAAQQAVRGG